MRYLQDAYFANLNAVCRDGQHYCHAPDGTWSVHEYAFGQNKFYYFLQGKCRITVDGKEYLAKGGDWFFIPAGSRHSYSHIPGESFEKYWIHFDLYPNTRPTKLLDLPVTIGTDPRATELFEELIRANSSPKLTDKLQAKACLLRLIALYVELCDLGDVTVSGEEEARIQEVLAHIEANLSRPIRNSELAALCHMHPNHFIRYFSKMTGRTPAAYVTDRRMETAKRLLETTNIPIAQIMEQIGLQEPNHFARLFRRSYSMTPREYRDRQRSSAI